MSYLFAPQSNASRIYSRDHFLHGSSRWASRAYLKEKGKIDEGRIFLGYAMAETKNGRALPITTNTEKHLITVAPTRSGKLVTSSAPRCMDHKGPLFVLDLKDGELALTTVIYRRDVLRHKVELIDPWDCAASKLGIKPSRFNVLDLLDEASEDFFENALIIAESTVTESASKEPHWDEEALVLIAGLAMYVKATPKIFYPTEKKSCDLPQVRRLLNLPPEDFRALLEGKYEEDTDGNLKLVRPGMLQSANEFVSASAGRILNKEKKEFSGILSTAHRNTHWLESPSIQDSLGTSDFSYSELEQGETDIYIVLPAKRVHKFSRFLRLHTSIGLNAVMGFETKPKNPVYFMIEEAAILGRLGILATAFGLMAGYGLQIHLILQDLNQLVFLYGDQWQTFIANSGVLQFFGTLDPMTREFISRLCGTTTLESLSEETAKIRASFFADPNFLTREDSISARPLITPDEVTIMHPATQILIFPHCYPVVCFKTAFFLDSRYRDKKGKPLFSIHPKHADKPLSLAMDFTKAGLDIGKILGGIFDGDA
ncbi:MAG: type IV secretory system conjugative DNA transfer family protein [Cellvibrionaceae bacterium]